MTLTPLSIDSDRPIDQHFALMTLDWLSPNQSLFVVLGPAFRCPPHRAQPCSRHESSYTGPNLCVHPPSPAHPPTHPYTHSQTHRNTHPLTHLPTHPPITTHHHCRHHRYHYLAVTHHHLLPAPPHHHPPTNPQPPRASMST